MRVLVVAALLLSLAFTASPSPAAAVVPNTSGGVGVSGGYLQSCAVRADGTVWCWGNGTSGQLGNGALAESDVPVQVVGITTATAVSVGQNQACALLADTTVKCWGIAAHADGTYAASEVPIVVGDGAGGVYTGATDLALGGTAACVVTSGGGVACWGPSNNNGQLGGNAGGTSPVAIAGITGATDVDLGQEQACAVVTNGAVKCWGSNGKFQLGDGGTEASSATPVDVTGIDGVSAHATAIAAGRDHSCALLSTARMMCWGGNFGGRIGDGTGTDRAVPVPVVELTGVEAIDVGDQVSCAVRTTGTAWCWGYNNQGEVGSGTRYWPMIPAQVKGITNAVGITAGFSHTCAVLSDGQVRCWGTGSYGVTGDTVLTDHLVPTAVRQFPPRSTKPVASLRAGAGVALVGSAAPVTVRWITGDGSGLGVATLRLARSVNGGVFGAPAVVAGTVVSTTAPTSGTVAWRASATDEGGYSRTGSAGDATAVRLVQQASATFTGTWSSSTSTSYSGGSVRSSMAAAATASFRVTARSLALVGTRGASRGKLKVYVDGVLSATVDCYRASTQYRAVLWATTFLSSGVHTVKVVVVGTAGRPRVDVDALVTIA